MHSVHDGEKLSGASAVQVHSSTAFWLVGLHAVAALKMQSASYTLPVKRSRMGSCCAVPGCSLRSGTNLLSQVRTFRFPIEDDRRNAWIAAVRRDKWQPTKSSEICSAHFIQGTLLCGVPTAILREIIKVILRVRSGLMPRDSRVSSSLRAWPLV